MRYQILHYTHLHVEIQKYTLFYRCIYSIRCRNTEIWKPKKFRLSAKRLRLFYKCQVQENDANDFFISTIQNHFRIW